MKILSLLRWLDDNILVVLSSFLLAFIPLYPKLPLFEAIPGYIVRVRLEDILILVTMLIWFIQVLRKKIPWKTPLTFVVVAYAIVGLLSTISAVFITQTVPAQLLHVGKTLLHYFRYLEYFSLLFLTYSSINTAKRLKLALAVITVTVIAITIYGIGQRYWYWPVYSTMNREFSKGIRLYLTEHARVQSTFGGHYDLAAYLVIMTPLLLTASYVLKNRWVKAGLFATFLAAYWLIIATASRTSYAAFFLAIGVAIALSAIYVKKDWLGRSLWALKEYVIVGTLSLIMLATFGSSMYERILQSLEAYPDAYNSYTETVKRAEEIKTSVVDSFISKEDQEQMAAKIKEKTKVEPPENSLSVEDAAVLVSSDTQPTKDRPSDVYVDVPVLETVATVSANGTVTEIVVEKERTYTDTAQIHGLSVAIRLDTLWPRALEGFERNPLLGSGYATLTKETIGQFTEAESTDNNFLRTLGETGILGFITFYGAVLLTSYFAAKALLKERQAPLVSAFLIAFIAATAGLLLNAVFIDVFAASKVALTYWALAGIVVAIYSMQGYQPAAFDFMYKVFPEKITSAKKKEKTGKRKKSSRHT